MENNYKYKIIFSDLDNTLLVDNHIPSFNLEAIKKAQEKGVKFVICTGRNFSIMNHLLKELNTENSENEYTICNSGAMIYENKNQKIIHCKQLDDETLKLLFEYGKSLKDILIIFDAFDGKQYVYNEALIDKEKWKDFKYTAIKSLDDLENTKIIRLIFHNKNNKYLLNIKNELKNNKSLEGRISYFISSNMFLEINAFGVCKGEALKWLSNYLNIDIKETIAIGDDFNDESMIECAGLGCCVKSGKEEIKRISKYICEKDYFEGGVKEVIEKFILN